MSRSFRAIWRGSSRKAAERSPPISSRARKAAPDNELAEEMTEVVKTLGHVAEYWLADPQRTVELQTRLGKAYLDLWASAVKRLAGEETAPVVAPAAERQALRRSGMVLEPVLRFPQAGLSPRHALGQPAGQRRRRARPAHQAEGRVLRAADRQRAVAVEFRSDQSGIAARDAHQQCRQPGARHAHAGRGHRGRRRRPENPPVGFVDVRGRPQSGDHARQGDLPERAHAAHPICAVDRDRAQTPAADRAALDQQILRARSHAGKILHQMVRRSGAHRLLHLLGQSRRRASRRRASKTTCAKGRSPRSTPSSRRPARTKVARHRLLRRRHAAGGRARGHGGVGRRAHRVGDVVRRPGRFHLCRRSQGLRRRGAGRRRSNSAWPSAAISKASRWRPCSTCCGRTI